MTTNPFDEFLEILEYWSTKGEKYLADGTRLICATPHIAPEAWLHVVFPALSDEAVVELGRLCEPTLPDDFQKFLLRANGAFIFSYWISIWGLRRSYARIGDEAWQPYDMPSHNERTMRPAGSPDTVLYFASDEDGAAWCFFEPQGNSYRVGKTLREEFRPVQYWNGFWEWLLSETRRLSASYRHGNN